MVDVFIQMLVIMTLLKCMGSCKQSEKSGNLLKLSEVKMLIINWCNKKKQ